MAKSKLKNENLNKSGNELKKVSVDYEFYLSHNNIFYCTKNVIVDFNRRLVRRYPKHIVFADNFLIDTKANKITNYDASYQDGLIEAVGEIEKIDIKDNVVTIIKKDDKIKKLNDKTIIIKLKDNQIVSFTDNNLVKCGDFFMYLNQSVEELKMSKLQKCGDYFFAKNNALKRSNADLSALQQYGNCFFGKNDNLKSLTEKKADHDVADDTEYEYWWQRI